MNKNNIKNDVYLKVPLHSLYVYKSLFFITSIIKSIYSKFLFQILYFYL